MNEQRMREIFAEELLRESDRNQALADAVRNGSDNSWGGVAAVAAMRRVAVETTAEACADLTKTIDKLFYMKREELS